MLDYTQLISPIVTALKEVDASLNNVGKGLEWTTTGLGLKTGAGLALDGDTLYSTITGTRWSNSSGNISYTGGQVSIGAAAGSSGRLQVTSNGLSSPQIYLTAGDSGESATIYYKDGELSLQANNNTSTGTITFNGANTVTGVEYGRFGANGNFGLGSFSFVDPTNKLTVTGNASVSGNMGIGTTEPSNVLHIKKTNSSAYIQVESDGISSGQPESGIIFVTNDGNPSPPSSGENTHVAGKIVGCWRAGEQAWNQNVKIPNT